MNEMSIYKGCFNEKWECKSRDADSLKPRAYSALFSTIVVCRIYICSLSYVIMLKESGRGGGGYDVRQSVMSSLILIKKIKRKNKLNC